MLNWTATIWPIALSVAIKSSAVLAVAWALALLLRGRSAASRHVVWTACAAALIALPLLSIALPALRVPLASAILPGDPGLVFRTVATTAPTAPIVDGTARLHAAPVAPPIAAPRDWRTAVLFLWAAGAAVMWMQMLAAGWVLRRTRRAAPQHPATRQAALAAHALGIESPVDVVETADGMPMTFGILHPTIFLPAAAANWSESRRRIVLLHELAHVSRGDAATHLVARAALALHWWNPLAWTAWREFLKERERAADDIVLASGAGQSEYAGHLLEIARTMQSPRTTAAAAIAMARPSQLEGRLVAILADGVNRRQPGRTASLAAAAVAIALIAPLAAVRAQSVATSSTIVEVDRAIRDAAAQKNHEILDQAAKAYEGLRRWPEAQALREASLAMRGQESGTLSPDYADGLVKLGDLARKQGLKQQAQEYYTKAIEMGDRPETFGALVPLALDAYRAQNPDQAIDFLRRARNAARDGNQAGTAMTWMAFVKSKQANGAAEAESLYRGAMGSEDVSSSEQAMTMEFFATFLKDQDRAGEAEPLQFRAAEIRKARAAELGRKLAASATPLKVGGGVTPPRLLSKVEPEYSEQARDAKYQGTVLLQIVVDTDGKAKNISVIKSLGYGLDEKAVEAVSIWTFQPGTMGGVPVPVMAQIEVNFRLM
jgi:TonB family protein